ncbi:MAG: NACHT domain-containing protein [Bacteroidia bacterium]|nr:NACHT domain-containing protein [Bacteroidia bacterium]
MSQSKDAKEFEISVIRVARMMFPDVIDGGREIIAGHETDGVFITRDTIHLIECTISRGKDKALEDSGKLRKLYNNYERKYSDKVIKLWFVTKHEPTAEQRSVCSNGDPKVHAVSLNTFASRLVDASAYLLLRDKYNFGSARDPETGKSDINSNYIKLDIPDMNGSEMYNVSSIAKKLQEGVKFLVIGYFGAGKSMTLREVYKKLKNIFNQGETTKFPIFLNLRDHNGQTDPVEAIERHGRNIGFGQPGDLVKAWRAGYVTLILDGFDEIATVGFAQKAQKLKDMRYRSTQLVRKFIEDSPGDTAILVSGRSNFFDSTKECLNALSISNDWKILSIDDFTEEQMRQYLSSFKIQIAIPEWLPGRPLLLAYLTSKGIINSLPSSEKSKAEGWDMLLGEICAREAKMESGVEADAIREILERLASKARSFQGGLGPIYEKDLSNIFEDVTGYPPSDSEFVILQRLPGLGPRDTQDGSRQFIDTNLAQAAKAGQVIKYVQDPFNQSESTRSYIREWQESLEDLGLSVVRYVCKEKLMIIQGKWFSAVDKAIKESFHTLAVDIYFSLYENHTDWKRDTIRFSDCVIPDVSLDTEESMEHLIFKSTIVRNLIINSPIVVEKLPYFNECIFGHIHGQDSSFKLPPEKFTDCEYYSIDERDTTTQGLLSLDFPTPVKVAFTILKKIYIQSGSGRKENALYRGLDHFQQRYIADVLHVLKRHGYLSKYKSGSNTIWVPIKGKKGDAISFISGRDYSNPVYKDLERLSSSPTIVDIEK